LRISAIVINLLENSNSILIMDCVDTAIRDERRGRSSCVLGYLEEGVEGVAGNA